MYRVLIALVLALVAVQVSGCTGSLRLGSSVWNDYGLHVTGRA
ncbi:MAG: hypothetical protein WC829_07640 [Hyphomicrobium sp.]